MENIENLGFTDLNCNEEKLTEGGVIFLFAAVEILAGAAAVGFAAGAAYRLGEEVYNQLS